MTQLRQFQTTARVSTVAVTALMSSAVAAGTPALDDAMSAWAALKPPPNYRYALTDLNRDGLLDALVLMSDLHYCGSGGCTMVIFRGTRDGFEVVSRSTITREPIYLLPELNSGWHTLSVLVSGGGVLGGQVLLRFDGERYPYNPSMEPRATPAELESAERLKLQ